MKKSYVVIGLGRMGYQTAIRLCQKGADVLAIDNNEEIVNRIADQVTRAVTADAQDVDVLRALGVGHSDVGIVTVGSVLAANMLITMNLKSLGVPYVICKAHDNTQQAVLEKLGADKVIFPEQVAAERLAENLTGTDVIEHIELSEDYGIVELAAPAAWKGRTLRQLEARAQYEVNIIAVRSGQEILVSPSADYVVGAEDSLVMLGSYAALEKIPKIRT